MVKNQKINKESSESESDCSESHSDDADQDQNVQEVFVPLEYRNFTYENFKDSF
jgi:hypothetical protein